MGIGEVDGPPKKKLKQAQLPFSIITADKSGTKRKLKSECPGSGLALKVSRKEGTPRTLAFNKENVKVDSAEEIRDIVDLCSDKDDDDSRPTIATNVKVDNAEEICDIVDLSSDKEDEISGPTIATNIKEREVEQEQPAGNEQVDCKETVEDEDVESKVNEGKESKAQAANTQLKKIDGKEVKESIVDTVPKNDEAGESHDLKIVDEPPQERESTQEKIIRKNENAAIDGSKEMSDESKESKSTETSDLEKSPEKSLGSSQVESKFDQSIESDHGDPNSSVALSSEDEHHASTTPSQKGSATTPKLTKEARAKLREEKIRLKKEKEELKRQKQEEKEKKKQEELRMKEEERKKKEDEKKKREEAKEEEKKRKEEEKKKKEEAKEEEKRKKEEEKKKKEESKEEDRKKKEEARLAEERKGKLAKMAFTKYFIQDKSKTSAPKKEEVDKLTENSEKPKFMPFPVKNVMRLAAQVRHSISDEEKRILSDALESNCSPEKLYLDEIKGGLRKPCSDTATWPLSEEQHDVIIVESVVEEKSNHENEAALCLKTKRQRAKLLQFHDNRRPPYWGTWRKKSSAVTPRNPFGQDKVFDYEVDSDSEWEDEEEGEDIDKEGESDKEQSDDENVGEDGYLLDNTFVPHGYLSDEEAPEEEENLNPEDQKLKLKVLKQEFEQELKAKTCLKPRLLGCVWISNETTEVSKGSLYETLMNFRCKWDESEGPIDPSGPAVVDCSPSPSLASAKFPSTLVEQLVKLVHGSRLSHINLVAEFMNSLDKENQLSSISKRAVSLKIKDIASKTRSATGRAVWTVSPELRAKYGLPNLEPSIVTPPAIPIDTPPPKPKETALVNFLKKASMPSEPRRRVTPTLVSPIVDLTGTKKSLDATDPGNVIAPSDASGTGNDLAPSDASKTGTSVAPPDSPKPGNAASSPGIAKCGGDQIVNALVTPAAPPVRKRIQPITLSRTVSPATKTPSTPKMARIFKNPLPDTPRPPRAAPISQLPSVDLCNDST